MVKMVLHEAFACRCAKAFETLWMWNFLWKKTELRELMSSSGALSTPSYSAGPSTPPNYSSGPSTPLSYSSGPLTHINYSLGSSRNVECSNCKHLHGRISVLKGQQCQRRIPDDMSLGKSVSTSPLTEHDLRVLQDYLLEIDSHLDKGDGLPDDLPNHAKTFHDIGGIDRKISVDLAQKAKVKWAFEGTRILSIFPRSLGVDSSHDLKGNISNDEIKKAVWDCGSDKSPIYLIKARQILDGTLILNEIVSYCKSRKEQALLFKVDFQKRLIHLDGIILMISLVNLSSVVNGKGGFMVAFIL
nr:hypothetical protein [Tanacetum cinerariifolium]